MTMPISSSPSTTSAASRPRSSASATSASVSSGCDDGPASTPSPARARPVRGGGGASARACERGLVERDVDGHGTSGRALTGGRRLEPGEERREMPADDLRGWPPRGAPCSRATPRRARGLAAEEARRAAGQEEAAEHRPERPRLHRHTGRGDRLGRGVRLLCGDAALLHREGGDVAGGPYPRKPGDASVRSTGMKPSYVCGTPPIGGTDSRGRATTRSAASHRPAARRAGRPRRRPDRRPCEPRCAPRRGALRRRHSRLRRRARAAGPRA